MRNPRTPDCGIAGCTRAAYRSGLCRKHRALLPPETYLRASLSQMQAAHEAGEAYRAGTVATVQGLIDGWKR
jgi:hypothetical protein